MTRPRKRRPRSLHLSVSMTDEDWEMVRAAAQRRGLSIARCVVELALRDAPYPEASPLLALDAKEQREILETARALPRVAEISLRQQPPPALLGRRLAGKPNNAGVRSECAGGSVVGTGHGDASMRPGRVRPGCDGIWISLAPILALQ